MIHVTWSLYMISLLICFLSYLWCFYEVKGKAMTIDSYLFEGNTAFASWASIIGSTFSTVFLLGTMPAIYFSYSFVMYFPACIAAICGFLILRWSLRDFQKNAARNVEENINQTASSIANRYLIFLKYRKMPISFWIIALVYLILAFVSEVGALKNGLKLIGHADLWGDVTAYILAILAILYVYVGGFRGVLKTDILQMLFLLTALTIFCSISLLFGLETGNEIKENIQLTPFDPDVSRLILGSIAIVIVAVTWLSSAPEMFIRLLSITPKKVSRVIFYSGIGFFFALAIPIVFILVSRVTYPTADGFSAAFSLWERYLYEQSNWVVTIAFVFIIVSAAITTLDTMIITTLQLIQCARKKFQIISDQLPERYLRKILLVLFYLLILVGVRLPFRINILIGVFTYSMMIPIFFMQFISPRIFKTSRKPNFSYFIVLVIVSFVIYFIDPYFSIARLNYHAVPIVMAIAYIGHLIIYFGILKIKF